MLILSTTHPLTCPPTAMSSVNPVVSPFQDFAVKETATLTWTIDAFFAEKEQITSPTFSPPNSGNKFDFELKPSDSLFSLKHVFIELFYNGHEKEALFQYRVSILDANGVKHYTREYMWNYRKSDYLYYQYNATNYIETKECNQFLVNGNLTIYCEVDLLCKKQLPPEVTGTFEKLPEKYEDLLESGKLSDFTVLIGERQFKVHKMVLATRSAVFAAMFEHDDTKEVKEGRMVIEDLEVEVFEMLIRYIYTWKIESLDEYAAELFVAADRYQLDHLKYICEQSLISNLSTESVSTVLLLADMHTARQLKSKCTEFIVSNTKDVMQTDAWKQLIEANRIDLVAELLLASSETNKGNEITSAHFLKM